MIFSMADLQLSQFLPSLKSGLRRSEVKWILVVFGFSVVIRILPQIVAYPYPIGYDVINYYIPVTAHFGNHWPIISTQFPLYAIALKLASDITGLDAASTVTCLAVVVYATFVASLYIFARKAFGLNEYESIFFSI